VVAALLGQEREVAPGQVAVDALIEAANLLFCVVGREREPVGARPARRERSHFALCTLHFSICTELLAWRAVPGRSSPCGGS
jgi:hypothetical protein